MEQQIPHAVLSLPRQATDYVRGINSPIVPVINIASGDWSDFLPTNEPQKYAYDTDECTQLSGINSIETQFNWLYKTGKMSAECYDWFKNNGYIDANGNFAFSERFSGIKSGTTINGNSPWAFWLALKANGVLPRADLNYTLAQSQQFVTQEAMCADYYNPAAITQAMTDKALASRQWFLPMFEWLGIEFNSQTPSDAIDTALKQAPVHIAVPVCIPGWNNINIPFCAGQEANHAIMVYKDNQDGTRNIRDHYVPYDKALSKGYYIPQAILGVITLIPPIPTPPASLQADANKTVVTPEEAWYFSKLFERISAMISQLFG